jgi:hypothetical protein
MSDPQDRSEEVDEEVVGDGEYPPERPVGVGERLTGAEEQVGETARRRDAREEPEASGSGDGGEEEEGVGPLVAPGDEEGVDDEAQEVAVEAQVTADEGAGWTDWTTQDREEVVPAEEAAMHLTADPPMGDGDGYVDEDDVPGPST